MEIHKQKEGIGNIRMEIGNEGYARLCKAVLKAVQGSAQGCAQGYVFQAGQGCAWLHMLLRMP